MRARTNNVQRLSADILEKQNRLTTVPAENTTETRKGKPMNKLERFLKEWDKGGGEVVLLGDGDEQLKFGDAFLGITWREGLPVTVYDEAKVIQAYMDVDEMDYDEAVEFFQFNTISAYVGKQTPIFIDSQW